MTSFSTVRVLLGRELKAEFRTRELLSTTFVFALLVLVLFNFAFDPSAADSRRFGAGLLWIAFLFAAELMLQPGFVREQAHDTLSALRMSPAGSFAILASKMAANFVFLALAELVLVPVFSVLYNVSLAGVVWRMVLVLALGTFGIVVTGTVFSAISAQARMRELLLPLLLLPLLAPLLIAAVEVTAGLLAEEPTLDRTWLAFLGGFDIVFLTVSWVLCDYLFEE